MEQTLPFIAEALTDDEPVLVVVAAEKVSALRHALGDDAKRVALADMAEVGRNPARIIPYWRAFVDEHDALGRSVRGIGEPIGPHRSPDQLVECHRHEALLNVAFAHDPPFWLRCPYDTEALPPATIDAARRSHPTIATADGSAASPEYHGIAAFEAPLDDPLREPSRTPVELRFGPRELGQIRETVGRATRDAGLDDARADDLVVAVNEVATNSLRHGADQGRLRVWEEPHAVICEVSDNGCIDDPLADRRRPAPDAAGGRGLWIANGLCDLVQIRSSDSGTVVRLHAFRSRR